MLVGYQDVSNNCKTAINDCIGNLCENGARCVDQHLRYRCVCAAGYTGERLSNNDWLGGNMCPE